MAQDYPLITAKVLAEDKDFCHYLWAAEIKKGNRGGTFVGNRTVAPEAFRKYGIVLPKGGMILPQVEVSVLKSLIESDENCPTMDRDVEYVLNPDLEFSIDSVQTE